MAAAIDFSHGGNISDARRAHGARVIDFSASINPLGMTPSLKRFLHSSMDRILHYPDPSSSALVKRIARSAKIPEENILVGNGSIELIYLLAHAFLPKKVLIPVPTFSEYERAARAVGARIEFLKLREKDGFELPHCTGARADMAFLCNPNNPTGNLLAADRKLPAWRCGMTVIDEAFIDFLPDEKKHTCIKEAVQRKDIVVLRSFTKFFALPGLRLGYLVGHRDTIRRLKPHHYPWTVNVLAQAAGEAVLGDGAYCRESTAYVEKEKDYLFRELSQTSGLTIYPSAANFLFARIDRKGMNSSLLSKRMLAKGILIRDCINFRALSDRYFRVAVRTASENRKLVKALAEALKE
jgi:threonine-phosphate decarboxylase